MYKKKKFDIRKLHFKNHMAQNHFPQCISNSTVDNTVHVITVELILFSMFWYSYTGISTDL